MITTRVKASDVSSLQEAEFTVVEKHEEIIEESAPPPYSTADLLQDAVTHLGWSSSKVMAVAQLLFENGLITYPRTDSIRISPEASEEIRKVALALYGADVLPVDRRMSMDLDPGAHEAIRPTSPARLPGDLAADIGEDMGNLYHLIWQRAIAGSLKPARYRRITVELESHADQSV
jgi:DNA topoisomerase-1